MISYDFLRSLTIGSDPSDPFRSLRSLRSVPIPLIRVISFTHTLPVFVLSLPSHASHYEDKFHQRRALGDARRNLSLTTSEDSPPQTTHRPTVDDMFLRPFRSFFNFPMLSGILNPNFEISKLFFAAQETRPSASRYLPP